MSRDFTARLGPLEASQPQSEHSVEHAASCESRRERGQTDGPVRVRYRGKDTTLGFDHEHGDYDDTVIRLVRVEAPTFDGHLDPKAFLD